MNVTIERSPLFPNPVPCVADMASTLASEVSSRTQPSSEDKLAAVELSVEHRLPIIFICGWLGVLHVYPCYRPVDFIVL